jgi:DNA-binding NarL/FixJ family response regulator
MVASGLSSKEVAVRMSLAPRTVEKIRAEIMEKLEVRDFAGLVRWCVQNGIV